MPLFSANALKTDACDGTENPCGPYSALLLSDTGGLTQFGAFIEILPPGSHSSIKHWHANEDELVYMLDGEVTLHEGDTSTVMRAGDTATFKAGDPLGHALENTSGFPARYLVIGTRSTGDTVTYPDHDRRLSFRRKGDTIERAWTDLSGAPASSPYALPQSE